MTFAFVTSGLELSGCRYIIDGAFRPLVMLNNYSKIYRFQLEFHRESMYTLVYITLSCCYKIINNVSSVAYISSYLQDTGTAMVTFHKKKVSEKIPNFS